MDCHGECCIEIQETTWYLLLTNIYDTLQHSVCTNGWLFLLNAFFLDYVCFANNDCNSHGICNEGTCECESAWDSESDCSGNIFIDDMIHLVLLTPSLVLGKSHVPQILVCKYI